VFSQCSCSTFVQRDQRDPRGPFVDVDYRWRYTSSLSPDRRRQNFSRDFQDIPKTGMSKWVEHARRGQSGTPDDGVPPVNVPATPDEPGMLALERGDPKPRIQIVAHDERLIPRVGGGVRNNAGSGMVSRKLVIDLATEGKAHYPFRMQTPMIPFVSVPSLDTERLLLRGHRIDDFPTSASM